MRVIAGTARGRLLQAPRGTATRPMMDVVKGSLFNMLESLGEIEGRVLDLYAGSGSLGIEALSRGADFADFVEQSPTACAVIRDNLARLGFADRARVLARSVEQVVTARQRKPRDPSEAAYDYVFVDAPYPDRVSLRVLEAAAGAPLLAADATVCVGHHLREELPETIGALKRVKFRRFGASCISIYVRQNPADQEATR